MATRRTKSLSTKVTDTEYEQVANLAVPRTISEWLRDTVLRAANQPDPVVTALLAEVLALRIIVLNLQFAFLSGTAVTTDSVRGLIDRADREKWNKADERLAAMRARIESTSR